RNDSNRGTEPLALVQAHYADILNFRRDFWLANSYGKFSYKCFPFTVLNLSQDGYCEFPNIARFVLPLWEELIHDCVEVWQRFKRGQRLQNFSERQHDSSGMGKVQRPALKLHHG